MKLTVPLKINQTNISFENFGDEIVAINFETGSYFSFDKIGIEIWNLLDGGITAREIIDYLGKKYHDSRNDMQESLEKFLADLEKNNLILEVEPTEARESRKPEPVREKIKEDNKPKFEPPVLQEYSDMQELLLLDPIHEVDQTGWPNQPEENKEKTEK